MQPPNAPQEYNAGVEEPEPEEAETEQALIKTLGKIADTTFKGGGHALRSVHAKGHGFLKAELQVSEQLPDVLKQGLFATPGRYPAVMRFSTTPGDILHDKVSTPRGVALKLVGVKGERLPGSEHAVTQDFVMVNKPIFGISSGKALLVSLKFFEKTTDRLETVKKAMSVVLRQVEKVMETFGGESGVLEGVGGEQPRHILAQTFYSQLPTRYGKYIAKFSLAPVAPDLLALKNATIDVDADYNAIRTAIADYFSEHGGVWEMRVQLCTNLHDMPVEDAAKEWNEADSPYIAVARVTAPPQASWSEARATAVDDGMGFSPWHGLAAHQPLGALQRMRKLAYHASREFRSHRNSTPVREPESLDQLPA